MSKYRKRDIKRSIKENIKIDVIDFKDTKRVELEMEEFRLAHLKAAKRITRPKETWAYMEKILKLNKAKLFIATKDQNKLSFLFCGQFGKSAFGWSQVNYKKYEKTYPVRHYLEWYAIKYFKKKNFLFYEVGQRYYVNNKSKFSSKEIQISEFKERYGAKMYPIIYFESAINKINYGELNN